MEDQSFRRFPVLVRTGLGENLEARVVVGAYRYDEGATDRESGSGPLSLGAKYRISKGRGTALTPAWGLEVDLVVPGVFDEPYDGSIASGVTLNFDHSLPPSRFQNTKSNPRREGVDDLGSSGWPAADCNSNMGFIVFLS